MNKRFMNAESRHLLYEYLANYGKLCYNYLNGKVNPIMKSRELIIVPETLIEPIPDFTAERIMAQGHMIVNAVCFDPNILVALQETAMSLDPPKKFSIEELNGFVIKCIIHELSHVDQDIDFDRYNSDLSYLHQIEQANEYNTLRFININREEITKHLFDFAINNIAFYGYKEGEYSYKKISYVYQRFFTILNAITKLDTENLIRSSVEKYKTKKFMFRISRVDEIGRNITGFDIDLRGHDMPCYLVSDKYLIKALDVLRSLYSYKGYLVLTYYTKDRKTLIIECQKVCNLPPENNLLRTINRIPAEKEQSNIRKNLLPRYKKGSEVEIVKFFS